MPDDNQPTHEINVDHGVPGHLDIHLPPNSLVPAGVALFLCMTFVGFVDQVRSKLGPTIWLIGLVGLIACCVGWFRAARNEFEELPESLEDH